MYRTTNEMRAILIEALSQYLDSNPEMRVGQAIMNLVGDADMFNMYDEDILCAIVNKINGQDDGGVMQSNQSDFDFD